MSKKEIKFEELKTPMPFKWKPNNAVGQKVACVAYVDSRQVQDKLDEVVGPGNWSDTYEVIHNNLYCHLSINVTGDLANPKWVVKSDCGTPSMTEREKGESSDAFKRAAVKWGVGRFLYEKEFVKLNATQYKGKMKPVDDTGKILWDGATITEYINNLLEKREANFVQMDNDVPMPNGYQQQPQQPQQQTNNLQPIPVGTVKYDPDKGGANNPVPYSNLPWTPETINKIKTLERDGKTGSEVIQHFLTEYNDVKKTSYKTVKELNTDDLILDIITFIEEIPPVAV
tara:strand:- start:1533 stop:2387 length:855 start_codon:yes stop_codon:yes gene_type:complete